jgi:broad specificity phosphatase PhoE
MDIPAIEEKGLTEWRNMDEPEVRVRERMRSVFERAVTESEEIGPIGLVSHGGPIALLLLSLGMDTHQLAPYRKKFDTTNPLPPAGAWKVEKVDGENGWGFELAFTPDVS